MKVLFDHQTFSMQEYGGISRIYTELLKYAAHNDHIDADLSLIFSNNHYLPEVEGLHYSSFFKKKKFRFKNSFIYTVNRYYTKYKLAKGRYQLFQPTYYDPYFIDHLKGTPFVLTILDLIHEKFGQLYAELGDNKIVFDRKKILLEKAAKVIAISESTKKDIIEIFGTDASKIEVIYLGNSLKQPTGDVPNLLNQRYLLFVGNRRQYKNFTFFLRSISEFLKVQTEVKLICGGGGAFNAEEVKFIKELGIEDKVDFVKVDNDDTLVSLYTHAECFIFPSLYEGFGIPVLEAFSCGCPILLSNGGSLPEVAGDAVVYCDPEDSTSILNGVRQYLESKDLREQKAKEGLERLKLFSWEKTALETFNLYKQIAN